MKLTPLGIEGAWLAESQVWPDERGFFREWFKHNDILEMTGLDFSVKQANFSVSNEGVVRGIHYSLAPEGQSKLVTCVSGAVIDVIVDIRPDSPTFKQVEYVALTPDNGFSVLIQSGLGHGFVSLENNSGVSYLLSSPYSPEFELDISPIDNELNILWGEKTNKELEFIYSEKDLGAPTLQNRFEKRQLPNQIN
jgi:dTDP-4-dehydrorhamnose 3,5-epimerase